MYSAQFHLPPSLRNPPTSHQGHVIQDEAEGGCPLREVVAHLPGDQLSLRDELACVKARLVWWGEKWGRGSSVGSVGEQERAWELPATWRATPPHRLPRAVAGGCAEAQSTHHHRLEDLRGDGWQHALIIVLADAGEDAWQLAGHGPEEDAQRDVDVL